MKSRITFLGSLLMLMTWVGQAQEMEYDDLYFRSKDRPVLVTAKVSQELVRQNSVKETAKQLEGAPVINPTDSYSARNVNPEYISQTKVDPNSSDDPAPYFTTDFAPVSVNANLFNSYRTTTANNCMSCPNMGWGNSFYPYSSFGMMGYNPYSSFGMMGFNPYSSFYSPWGYDPFGYNSYYRPGWSWSLGMSMMWGSGGYYGMNPWMNFGYGGGFYNPWYGGGFGYPVYIINTDPTNGGRAPAYGKRTSRSTDLNNPVTVNNRNYGSTVTVDSQGRNRGSSGRVAANSTSDYYQRGWRTNPETRSSWSNSSSGRTGSGISSWSNTNNRTSRSSDNSWFNSNSGSRSSGWSGSNNSFSSGSGSRSSSGISSGGSSSSGGRRGRD